MRFRVLGCLTVMLLAPASCWGIGPVVFAGKGTYQPTDNGLSYASSSLSLKLTALRDDIIRVQISRHGAPKDDGSWSVLPVAKAARVVVTKIKGRDWVGFKTSALEVRLEKASGRVTILDLQGRVISADAAQRMTEFNGESYQVYKEMPLDEHYFGLGDKTGPLDRRGAAFALQATPAYHFQESADPLYKSIPFFIGFRAGDAYGILMDATWRGNVDFGKQLRDVYSFGAEGGDVNYYFIQGPTPKRVVENYAWLTGATPLPPLWTLGYQQCRHTYLTDKRVREVIDRFRADRIPVDAIYLDILFQDKNIPFRENKTTYPDLPGLVHYLREKQVRMVAITDMHIPVLPNVGYEPYDTGIAGDHFMKNPDGSRYVGKVWPGPSHFPDFMQKQTREWWATLYGRFTSMGIAGFWNDMDEPSVFDSPIRTIPSDVLQQIDEPGFEKRTSNHRELHNIYGMENSRATYEGLLKLRPNDRPFVLTRSTSSGGQRYAAVWTGDNSSTWNHLRLSTPMLLNLGLSGFSMAGDDIGGFAGTPDADLLTRWIEVGSFNPIDRNHTESGTADQEPWVSGPRHEDIRRKYIEERYRLLPYLYTLAEENSRNGMPMMRPLFLEFPDAAPDKHPLDIDTGNEFMLGASLLVAPPMFGEMLSSYPLILPSDDWFDYWTGKPVHSTTRDMWKSPSLRPSLEDLPVFVKAGTILPKQPVVQSTMEIPKGPLTLAVYPGPSCSGSLYLDDGQSFAYRKGEFLRQTFSCTVTERGLKIHLGVREGSYQPWWKQVQIVVYGWKGNAAIVSVGNEASFTQPIADATSGAVQFVLADEGKGADIALETVKVP